MEALNVQLLGICNPILDITATVPPEFLAKYHLKENDAILASEEHQDLGQEVLSSFPVQFSAGGSGQNTLRTAQFFLPKGSAAYVGCIGDDENGKIMRENVQNEGLTVEYQVDSQAPTGTCCVLINGVHRSLVANLSAANNLKIDHFMKPQVDSLIQQAKYFYATGFILTVCPEVLVYLGKHASESGKTFFFNLSAPFLSEFFSKEMMSVLPYADVVIGNESEAEAFAKANALPSDSSLEQIVQAIANLPKENAARSRIVVITHGSEPTIVFHDGMIEHFPVTPIDSALIKDTNGAGDVFCGGFIAQFIGGKPLKECVAFGNMLAGKIIQVSGATLDPKMFE